MSATINVLERFRHVLSDIKNGKSETPEGSYALRTLDMVERHIDALEKNQGFGAQKRADIAARLMESVGAHKAEVDMVAAARNAVKAADILLKELGAANALKKVWTHRTKGGTYEVIGECYGAGTCREQQMVIYRSLTSQVLYHRTAENFRDQMKLLDL